MGALTAINRIAWLNVRDGKAVFEIDHLLPKSHNRGGAVKGRQSEGACPHEAPRRCLRATSLLVHCGHEHAPRLFVKTARAGAPSVQTTRSPQCAPAPARAVSPCAPPHARPARPIRRPGQREDQGRWGELTILSGSETAWPRRGRRRVGADRWLRPIGGSPPMVPPDLHNCIGESGTILLTIAG